RYEWSSAEPSDSRITMIVLFFFFSSRRRHTRSKRDWSSDVCSSDLEGWRTWVREGRPFVTYKVAVTLDGRVTVPGSRWITGEERSEERRVGKECRSRWAPENEKKKT